MIKFEAGMKLNLSCAPYNSFNKNGVVDRVWTENGKTWVKVVYEDSMFNIFEVGSNVFTKIVVL